MKVEQGFIQVSDNKQLKIDEKPEGLAGKHQEDRQLSTGSSSSRYVFVQREIVVFELWLASLTPIGSKKKKKKKKL